MRIRIHFAKLDRITIRTAIVAVSLALIALLSAAQAVELESSKISGTVTDAAGGPIARAHVYINNTGEPLDMPEELSDPRETTTDKNGKYELTLRYPKHETLVVLLMVAETQGYVRDWKANISLQGGNQPKLDFALENGEVIAGTIRLPPAEVKAGLEVKDRTILVEGPTISKMPQNARLHSTDKDGKFEFYVPRGEYTLTDLQYVTDDDKPQQWKGIKSGQRGLELTVPPFQWTPENVGKVFDDLWTAVDHNYSYFFLKKDVDWNALHDTYRPVALKARDAKELAAVLKDMLAPLNDLHVWITTPSDFVGTAKKGGYIYNGNRDVVLSQLVDRAQCGKFAIVGKTKRDGFGYFLMLRQSDATEADVKTAVEAIGKLQDARGFVVDLRNANGGSEPLALEIAQLFCAKETVYAKSKYRNGPSHDEFGETHDRRLPATSQAFTKPVVCLIGPGAVSSGEGFVQMMKCLHHVTTVGMPTRGASGNPNGMPLGRTGVVVYYSSWVDMLPNGEIFEGVGIAPAVRVDLPNAAYGNADPTLEKGLEVLRSKLVGAK